MRNDGTTFFADKRRWDAMENDVVEMRDLIDQLNSRITDIEVERFFDVGFEQENQGLGTK